MYQVRKNLFLTEDGMYLHCTESAIQIRKNGKIIGQLPPTAIEQIVIMSNCSISNYLVKYCNENNIQISYISPNGKYYGRIVGETKGNVLLREKQYQMLHTEKSIGLIKNILLGKFINSRTIIENALKNPKDQASAEKLKTCIQFLNDKIQNLYLADNNSIDSMRGIEGQAAVMYFSCFDCMLKSNEDSMKFESRSKRPPLNNFNAVLSLLYALLINDCVAALETNGLDSYCGYLHALHSGRESLACDLAEEFRAAFVDEFVFRQVNLGKLKAKDFENVANSIHLKKTSLKKLLNEWSRFKEEEAKYSLDKKSYPRKLIPYLQARMMAEYVRGDIDEYPP